MIWSIVLDFFNKNSMSGLYAGMSAFLFFR